MTWWQIGLYWLGAILVLLALWSYVRGKEREE